MTGFVAQVGSAARRLFKLVANTVALVLVLPAALLCWIESALHPAGEDVLLFWAHLFALVPGYPGNCLRRAYYRLVLERCCLDFEIGFGAFFTHRHARVERGVYIGPYAVIGSAYLRTGCLVGTRASLLSGAGQHELDADGRWASVDRAAFQQIEIGEHTWIGEAATVMADVGNGSAVAAGAVVSAPVPPGVIVAGNPARFVRKARREAAAEPAQIAGSAP